LCLSVFLAALSFAGCRNRAQPAERELTTWKPVGSWSGRGDKQTETFTSDNGGFRVTWATKNETVPGEGRLKVIFRSGDSGRPIIDAVDARGEDHDVEIVSAERPRWYYLTIESANVDWTVTVDERIDYRQRVP
jgi:hypothetical protein